MGAAPSRAAPGHQDVQDPRLASGSAALLVVFAVLAGLFVVLFPYFQAVLGWSAIRSTTGLLPKIVVMMLAPSLAPKPAKRLGSRVTMLIGLGAAAAGLRWRHSCRSKAATLGAPGNARHRPRHGAHRDALDGGDHVLAAGRASGVASALNDTTREVGSAVGIAAR